ncbi:hypothetical protein BJ878DRAFT_544001 [Calycina marina]|uniref:Uncharacterized protein n=1 Tax=Calycina marina TaxID=1763456 RepID=A0A9P8CD64_9HELO|nr:hypothetical protein BJ878DRAFT_544001 [Calycina marina]
MRSKNYLPNASVSAILARLASADKQINVLDDKILPIAPHLLEIPSNPLPEPHYDSWKNNLFDKSEGRKYEYLTLQSSADRGICLAQGNWWEEPLKAGTPGSAGSQTGTSTPQAFKETKTPKVKLSLGDYKNFKSTGVKPVPRPPTATANGKLPGDIDGRKSLHSRNMSAVSVTMPMFRVSSVEGTEIRANGIETRPNSLVVNKITKRDNPVVPPRSTPSDMRDARKAQPVANGNVKRNSLQTKSANKNPRPTRSEMQRYDPDSAKQPPRPRSLPDDPELKQQKRSLELGDASRPEKRAKVETPHSTSPAASSKAIPRKSLPSETKAAPTKVQNPSTSAQTPPIPKKVISSTRPIDLQNKSSKGTSNEKPHLPPLLSPLPADITVPAQPNKSGLKKSEASKSGSSKVTSQKPMANNQTNTIVVKPRQRKTDAAPSTSSPHTTPASSTSPFVLPLMLSPGLPDVVEAELNRLQNKVAPLNTVEGRYEKVRQPGALGVPQKTTRPKLGHPPKKNLLDGIPLKKPKNKDSLIAKLDYTKSLQKTLERMLRLRPVPWQEFKDSEKKRIQEEKPNPFKRPDTDSDQEISLSKSHGSKTPASATAKKHVPPPVKSESDDSDFGGSALTKNPSRGDKTTDSSTSRKRPAEHERVEPPLKRSKILEGGNAKVSAPLASGFKSPTVTSSALRDNLLLSTPRKSGATKKSTAMGRVMSSDEQARTPKELAATSTPASSEKPRAYGHRPDVDKAQLDQMQKQNQAFFALGTNLKRHLQSKLGSRPDSNGKTSIEATGVERKKAVMKGVESIMAYMLAFYNTNQISQMKGHTMLPESWKDLFPVWHFVHNSAKPYAELIVLLMNLAAVAREQMCKIFIEVPPEHRDNEAFLSAYRDKDRLWAGARLGQPGLRKLSADSGGTLGPWTTVPEAVAFGGIILERYAAAQNVEDWKSEESFKSVPALPVSRNLLPYTAL